MAITVRHTQLDPPNGTVVREAAQRLLTEAHFQVRLTCLDECSQEQLHAPPLMSCCAVYPSHAKGDACMKGPAECAGHVCSRR